MTYSENGLVVSGAHAALHPPLLTLPQNQQSAETLQSRGELRTVSLDSSFFSLAFQMFYNYFDSHRKIIFHSQLMTTYLGGCWLSPIRLSLDYPRAHFSARGAQWGT